MAARGAKPKPVKLRLVDGTHTTSRHGKFTDAQKSAETAVAAFGKLVQPRGLKREVADAWRKYIAPAAWLDGSREAAAIAFCELWADFRHNPPGFAAGKHGQMRAYMAELGLTDERNRGADGKKDDDDDFFG